MLYRCKGKFKRLSLWKKFLNVTIQMKAIEQYCPMLLMMMSLLLLLLLLLLFFSFEIEELCLAEHCQINSN